MKKIKFFMCNLIAIAMLCTFMTSCDEDGVAEMYDTITPNSPIASPRSYPINSNDSASWNSVDSINLAQTNKKPEENKEIGHIGTRASNIKRNSTSNIN